jgi:23S rRNA pseudouridine1911/1915/1917 synthase
LTSWPTGSTCPPGWLPAALNGGWIYKDRVGPADRTLWLSEFYASRYRHSDRDVWRRRLETGEIRLNGGGLKSDGPLAVGDRLAWHRPPWQEEAVPGSWRVVFDDGDLYVIDKPSGLPVLPGGGWLEHTLLRLLQCRLSEGGSGGGAQGGAPQPVHRLGRHTTGLLVCARTPGMRSWLSALLRESTAAALCVAGGQDLAGHREMPPGLCRKTYRALTTPFPFDLAPGESFEITTPIRRNPHPHLGQIWSGSAPADGERGLPAISRITLLERRNDASLVDVTIGSGRPHQIRIHLASIGAPLLRDPLFLPGGEARPGMRPGDGGYLLHAHQIRLPMPDGGELELEAPCPPELCCRPVAS